MSTRLNITISDDLNNEIDKAAAESETNKSEIFRKALTLYLAMYESRKKAAKSVLLIQIRESWKPKSLGYELY